MSDAPRKNFDGLLSYVTALPPEKVPLLRLEEMAICAAWFLSYHDSPEKCELYAAVPKQIDLWLSQPCVECEPTEGRRQQPLLRKLLHEAGTAEPETLTCDVLDFLLCAWDLMQRSVQSSQFARPSQLLKPVIVRLQKQREGQERMPGLPSLSDRVSYFTVNELRRAEVRDVKTFAGIDVAFRGPVMVSKCDARLIEGLPGDCAMVVEEGSCCVSGMLLGYLAATEACEIQGNVSGVVVGRRGDIRAANLLNQATAISKEGNVLCSSAQDPRMVYGAKSVEIRASALSGAYLGRQVLIGGEIVGGEIQASELVRAGAFRHTPERDLSIVLRRGLNCQDYGEVLPHDALKMLSNATRLSQRLANIRRMQEITSREADEYAGTSLIFLLGEDETSTQMQRIQKFRRRLAFLDRLIVGAKSFSWAAEDRLNHLSGENANRESSETAGSNTEGKGAIEDLQHELMMLAAEGTIDRDLFDHRESVLILGRRLQRKHLSQQDLLDLIRELSAAVAELTIKRNELGDVVERREDLLQRAMERTAILERAKANCSRVEVLDQLLAAGRDRDPGEMFRRRTSDRYFKLMRRNIENRLSRVVEYRANVQDIESRICRIRTKLWEEYLVSLTENILSDWTGGGARVEGVFEEGIRLCAWKHLIEHQRGSAAGLLITPDSEGQTSAYARTSRGSIERV